MSDALYTLTLYSPQGFVRGAPRPDNDHDDDNDDDHGGGDHDGYNCRALVWARHCSRHLRYINIQNTQKLWLLGMICW